MVALFLRFFTGTVGIPVGTQISIRSDDGSPLPTESAGEVCIRGENVFSGYWENPKANAESFWPATHEEESSSSSDFKGKKWFRTGDQGLIIKEGEGKGSVQLTGRIKELINRGGEKISPLEVDHALLSVEGVKEAVCFGVENSKYGEVVWAGIVLDGQREGTVQDVERIKKALEPKISKVMYNCHVSCQCKAHQSLIYQCAWNVITSSSRSLRGATFMTCFMNMFLTK